MSSANPKIYHCPVEVTLDLIGGRWKPLILWHLKEQGILRHGELRRLIPNITQKMLTQQLRQLETDGLVQRTQHPEVPPRVEYALTDYGKGLKEMLERFCEWGEAHARRANITIVETNGNRTTPPPQSVTA